MSNVLFPVVESKNGKPITSSLNVAAYFGRRHKNVLRDIGRILQKKPQLLGLNFELTHEIKELGTVKRAIPVYLMDQVGFTLLAMGFTGEQALDFKLAYIQQFEAMKRAIDSAKTDCLQDYISKITRLENEKAKASLAGQTLPGWKSRKLMLLAEVKALGAIVEPELPLIQNIDQEHL